MENNLLLFTEQIGIASAALSGFLFAVRQNCDYLGIFLSAFLTALGGGILRDVLVDRPIYSFTHYAPVSIVIAVMVCAAIFGAQTKRENLEKKFIFIFTDAIDVVSFSIVGAMIACECEFNFYGVILIAFLNGVGGGILRDVLLNEVPWLLKTGLYGTISMSVGLVYFLLNLCGFTGVFAVMTLFCGGVIFRLIAYYKSWHLPNFNSI